MYSKNYLGAKIEEMIYWNNNHLSNEIIEKKI